MDWFRPRKQTKLYADNPRFSISIYRTLPRTRLVEPHDNTTFDHHKFRDRHNKYVHAIAATVVSAITCSPVMAADVGGVSATANPIANSSGSVTNQAIQVLQGP